MTMGFPEEMEPIPKKSKVPALVTYIGVLVEPNTLLLPGVVKVASKGRRMPLLMTIGPVLMLLWQPSVKMPVPFLVSAKLPTSQPTQGGPTVERLVSAKFFDPLIVR